MNSEEPGRPASSETASHPRHATFARLHDPSWNTQPHIPGTPHECQRTPKTTSASASAHPTAHARWPSPHSNPPTDDSDETTRPKIRLPKHGSLHFEQSSHIGVLLRNCRVNLRKPISPPLSSATGATQWMFLISSSGAPRKTLNAESPSHRRGMWLPGLMIVSICLGAVQSSPGSHPRIAWQ